MCNSRQLQQMFRRRVNQDKVRRRGRGPILERVVRHGPSDQETFEQKPKGSEGPDHLAMWSKCIAGRSNSKMLLLKGRKCLECSKNDTKASVGRAY